jgi:hypothetical protein
MTHLKMIVVSAVLMVGVVLAPAASAGNPARSNNTKCEDAAYAAKHPLACKPKDSNAKGATAALTATDLAKTIAEMAGKEAGKELGGFLFNQIGLGVLTDPTSGDLQALKSQLDIISGQITTLQNSVQEMDAELAQIHLTQFTEPLTADRTSIESLYMDDFQPVLKDLQKYVEEALADPACQAKTACDKAKAAFDEDLAHFIQNASTTTSEKLNIDIHDHLMPANGDSALIAYGKVLMKGSGFLTSADSDKLLAFYRYWSGYEALAMWMKAEYRWTVLATRDGGAADFSDLVRKQISGQPCQAPQTGLCGFFDLEQKQLPPAIPKDALIALPANTTARTTTLGQPMWLWNARVGPNAIWDPTKPDTANHSVPLALTTLNTTSAGIGFTDWRVPSPQDLNGLFAGRSGYANLDGIRFLDKVLPDSITSFHQILWYALFDHPFLWTSAAPPPVPCNVSVGGGGFTSVGNITNYGHTGLQISAKLADYPGKFPLSTLPLGVASKALVVPGTITTVAGSLQWCRDAMAARVTAGFANLNGAQLLVTRQTTVNYMPVP